LDKRPSPALVLRLRAATSAAERDGLVASLADHSLVAIQEDHPESPRSWIAHFASPDDRDRAREALAADPVPALESVVPEDIPDEDWARRTQADLPAVTIGRITVAPPWDLPATARSGRIEARPGHPEGLVLVIEPSRGFGTGHHQSTRLCLLLLQRMPLDGMSVIDVGTGSGVLAIAAAVLGAARVDGIDEDPDAVENARENVERNRVADRVAVRVGDALAPAATTGRAELVTANLTGTLLTRHADAVAACVRDGGRLIVSGFTVDERERVLAAFSGSFELADSAEEDGWWAFLLSRISPDLVKSQRADSQSPNG
jgi:ribosomal protein L11 methyltransferase